MWCEGVEEVRVREEEAACFRLSVCSYVRKFKESTRYLQVVVLVVVSAAAVVVVSFIFGVCRPGEFLENVCARVYLLPFATPWRQLLGRLHLLSINLEPLLLSLLFVDGIHFQFFVIYAASSPEVKTQPEH